MTKRILVTGGSRGIGKSIVTKLSNSETSIDFVYRQTTPEIDIFCRKQCQEFGEGAVNAIQCDLSNEDEVEVFCKNIEKEKITYDVFVHNAGGSLDGPVSTVSVKSAKELMQLHFWSFVRIVKSQVKPMARGDGGKIVAVTSISARVGARGNGVYAASKAALEAYVRVICAEYAGKGINANCVAPGYVDTNMISKYPNYQSLAEAIPQRRFAEPAEIADVVALLTSEGGGYINGQTIVMDGGACACY